MFIDQYVKTLDNPVLVESLTNGYKAIYEGEFVNGEPPFTDQEIKMMVKILQANAKQSYDNRTPAQMEKDIKASPNKMNTKAIAKRARMALQKLKSSTTPQEGNQTNVNDIIKSHGSVQYANNVKSADGMEKHLVREAYYKNVLDYIAKTYSDNGIPFDRDGVMKNVMDADKDANEKGGFATLRIANMPFPFTNVMGVNKNPIIQELRNRNHFFNGIVARWSHLMYDLYQCDKNHDAVGKKMRIEQFIDEENGFKAGREKMRMRKEWKHLDELENDIYDLSQPTYIDEDTIDLSCLDQVDENLEAKFAELNCDEPKFGESLGEFYARLNSAIEGDDSKKKLSYAEAKQIYQKSMGNKDLHDYPNDNESYEDYLKHSRPHEKESWRDFAYRLYYDSVAAYGTKAPGTICRFIPEMAKMVITCCDRITKYNIPKIAIITMIDWIIINHEFGSGRSFDVFDKK